jgi:hypothetical protein
MAGGWHPRVVHSMHAPAVLATKHHRQLALTTGAVRAVWQEATGAASYCWTGTSQATPITTGAAVLVLSVLAPRNGGNLTALWPTVKAALFKSVTVGAVGALPSSTNGRLNALAAVHWAITSWCE